MPHAYTRAGYNKTVVPKKHPVLAEFLVFASLAVILYIAIILMTRWHAPINKKFSIDLSYSKLPYYAALSTGRMAIAYIISLVFSFIFARAAVMNRKVERVMIAVLDILQSIPILSFMPGVVLGLVALFPHTNLGLELAAIILIFTSQAWNITFGFYQTLVTTPQELKEAALINRLSFWQRFTRLEVPSGMISLIWNSMMSWAGGWFFLMASEQFTLGDKSYQLPGIGSYLQAAANRGDIAAIFAGLATLIVVIVLLDQLLWRPLIAWGDRFKLEQDESGDKPHSWFLSLLRQSRVLAMLGMMIFRPLLTTIDTFLSKFGRIKDLAIVGKVKKRQVSLRRVVSSVVVVLLLLGLGVGVLETVSIIRDLSVSEWKTISVGAFATLLRVAASLLISVLWTVPFGVAIGLNSKWSKRLQPLVQMTASVPATALFPVLLLVLLTVPSGLNIAAIILMLLGTQWYVLFNVIAGAMAIPNDLKEATSIFQISGWSRWRYLILPSIFPYLVTGMITAAGGAWNASIISEYVTFARKVHKITGLGAIISSAANANDFHLLLASTLTMAILVFAINRLFWQRLYRLAENKYHFE